MTIIGSAFDLVSWLFSVECRFGLSCGDETTCVCVSHTHTRWHTDSILYAVLPHGKNTFSSYSTLSFPWQCNLAWPEPYAHSLSRSIPWACGTASHKTHRSLVRDWLAQRACFDSEVQPMVERPWKSAGLRASQGQQYTGSFPICRGIQLLLT